jgi:hypothetical protein
MSILIRLIGSKTLDNSKKYIFRRLYGENIVAFSHVVLGGTLPFDFLKWLPDTRFFMVFMVLLNGEVNSFSGLRV